MSTITTTATGSIRDFYVNDSGTSAYEVIAIVLCLPVS